MENKAVALDKIALWCKAKLSAILESSTILIF